MSLNFGVWLDDPEQNEEVYRHLRSIAEAYGIEIETQEPHPYCNGYKLQDSLFRQKGVKDLWSIRRDRIISSSQFLEIIYRHMGIRSEVTIDWDNMTLSAAS